MNFVYLEKIENLLLFLYAQINYLKENVTDQELSIQGETPKSPLFGMILIENIESYFGGNSIDKHIDYFDHKSMGKKFFCFLKLLKTL